MDDFQFCIQTLSYCIATLRIPNYFQTPTTFLIHYLTSVQHSKYFFSLLTKGDGKKKVKKKSAQQLLLGHLQAHTPSTSPNKQKTDFKYIAGLLGNPSFVWIH